MRLSTSNLSALTQGYRWGRLTIGQSDAEVYRLTAAGRPALVLKRRPLGGAINLAGEAERFAWLQGNCVRAPLVLGSGRSKVHEWLLVTALAGCNAVETTLAPAAIIAILAQALLGLHALEVPSCPFDETCEAKIGRAAANLQSGVVDESDFDDDHLGQSAEALFESMLALRPDREDLVVTHGDACLPNFLIDDGAFTGFVDCGSLGRADRYQDLALSCRSITNNLGGSWVAPFLTAYGLDQVDPARLYFYRLLDEFF